MRLLTPLAKLLALSALLVVSGTIHAHGGGADEYGCHKRKNVDEYHCHTGVLSGQTFSSQTEMLEKAKCLQAGPSLEDRLRELKDQKEKGVITEVEYQEQREQVLGEL